MEALRMLMDELADAGTRPVFLAKNLMWKQIARCSDEVKSMAKMLVSWDASWENGYGSKSEWAKFRAGAEGVFAKWADRWKEHGSKLRPPPLAEKDLDLEALASMAIRKVKMTGALERASLASVNLNEFLLEAPAAIRNSFRSHVGWDMEKGVFSAPQGKGDLINTLCAIAGLPPTEKTG